MRSIVIFDAKGIIRTRQMMLLVFCPSDRSVITSIYAARSETLTEKYESLKKK
jgi:hypothetical protein